MGIFFEKRWCGIIFCVEMLQTHALFGHFFAGAQEEKMIVEAFGVNSLKKWFKERRKWRDRHLFPCVKNPCSFRSFWGPKIFEKTEKSYTNSQRLFQVQRVRNRNGGNVAWPGFTSAGPRVSMERWRVNSLLAPFLLLLMRVFFDSFFCFVLSRFFFCPNRVLGPVLSE